MKTRILILTMLFALLVLPAAIYAQETEPEAVVTAYFEAFNAGDVERAVAYYADDEVWHIQHFYEPYVGKEAIRAAMPGSVSSQTPSGEYRPPHSLVHRFRTPCTSTRS